MSQDLKNKLHPESNMIGRIMDKEVVGLWELSQRQGGHSCAELAVEANFGAHDLLRSPSPSIRAVPAAAGSFGHLERLSLRRRFQQDMLKHLFKMYLGIDDVMHDLWVKCFVPECASSIKADNQWPDGDASEDAHHGWTFSARALPVMLDKFEAWGQGKRVAGQIHARQALHTVRFFAEVEPMKEVIINGVSYKQGSWLCARPNELDDVTELHHVRAGLPRYGGPRQMWFGKVRSAFLHRRAVGAKEVFEVEWHATVPLHQGGPYDVQLQCPIVRKPVADLDDPFFAASSVLPVPFTMTPTDIGAHFAMVSPSWHSLAAAMLPVPWPALIKY